jgi:hypothetical protein
MSDEIDIEGAAAVLAGIISGRSIESIEKELLAKGLSREKARDLLARGLAAKEAMGDQVQSLRAGQMRHPKESSPPGGKYFEAPVSSGDHMLCSDRDCPCPGQSPLDPGRTGYLYISKEVVEMRRDALTWEQLASKVQEMQKRLGATIMFDSGTANPVFLCEQGARRRNLDLEVAAADAANWAKTGSVPLRATPTTRAWWKF